VVANVKPFWSCYYQRKGYRLVTLSLLTFQVVTELLYSISQHISDIISQPFLIERTTGLRGTRPVLPVEALIEGELRFRLDISTHSSFPLLTR
jgi:hypothetical protein